MFCSRHQFEITLSSNRNFPFIRIRSVVTPLDKVIVCAFQYQQSKNFRDTLKTISLRQINESINKLKIENQTTKCIITVKNLFPINVKDSIALKTKGYSGSSTDFCSN